MQAVRSLGFQAARDSRAEVLVEETLTTGAIEGERYDPKSVRSSVARRLGLSTAGFPPPERRIDGLVQVLQDAVQDHAAPLTGERLKGWQAALFPTGHSGVRKIRAGDWRRDAPMRVVSGSPRRVRIHYEAPPGERVRAEMSRFLAWWNAGSRSLDGLLRAGLAHFHFVSVHPFEDGNGRLARALTDMALAQDERSAIRFYSLSARILAERKAYYDTLERAQRGTLDLTEWLVWFLGCFERAIVQAEKTVSKTLERAAFWQRLSGLPLSDRQRQVLRKLLEAGPGGFEGGLTTRKFVAMTRTSRATAFREIDDLVRRKLLRPRPAGGRSQAYELAGN